MAKRTRSEARKRVVNGASNKGLSDFLSTVRSIDPVVEAKLRTCLAQQVEIPEGWQ